MGLKERWASGDAYEPFIGRWSRLVAARFVDALNPARSKRWLDIGCGTGALTQTIIDRAQPNAVRGVDPSDGFIAHARAHIADPRAEFDVADARSLPLSEGSFDYVVSGLVLNFVSEPAAAVAEMRRVARPSARVASYVWDYADGMQMLRYFWDAASDLDPDAAELDEAVRFPLCSPEHLRLLWEEVGLADVGVMPIEVPAVFADFDDYWRPFLGGQGPAPTYTMSLDPDARNRLGELLRRRLRVGSDGTITLTTRAWMVSGSAP